MPLIHELHKVEFGVDFSYSPPKRCAMNVCRALSAKNAFFKFLLLSQFFVADH